MSGLNWADLITIIGFLGLLVFLVGKSFKFDASREDFFMAGKNLSWPVIGFSIFATNISTEHFIGMAGASFKKGFVMACYEWLGIMVIIVVAIFILPKYLRAGINTLPEYLEYRYDSRVRLFVSVGLFLAYVFLTISGMLYANVVAVETFLGYHSPVTFWVLATISAVLAVAGGLKTVVKLETVFAIVMIFGGILVAVLAVVRVGGFEGIMAGAPEKMHSLLPSSDPDLPWHSIILGGFWFGGFFYFGFNQYMMQKLFTTTSLSTAQKGFLLAASLKLIIPFIIVLPAIIAYILYAYEITDADSAYPMLALEVLPIGFKGIFYCMLFAAVFGSFISILNSASTVFSIDIYKRFLKTEATDQNVVKIGRISIIVILIVACFWAPHIQHFGGVFVYVKKYFGLIYPSVIVIFVAGWISKKVAPWAALATVIANPIVFLLYVDFSHTHVYLTTIAYVTLTLGAFITILTWLAPWKGLFFIPDRVNIQFERNLAIFVWAIFLFSTSLALLVVFI